MTLTEFLLARIAEDEDHAKRAAFGWGAEWSSQYDPADAWSRIHTDGKRDMVGCEDHDVIVHIARWDPVRVLAECEAKRRIVKLHTGSVQDCVGHYDPDNPDCDTLRELGVIYADRPGYDQDWRPRD